MAERSNTVVTGRLSIFLLVGQSNMAGRGRIGEAPALTRPDVFMFRQDLWVPAEEPLHQDKPKGPGVGPGMSFAVELLANEPGMPVGLVPCAVGGTKLANWMPGADLFENAVSVATRTMGDGTIAGILWHQGESDSGNMDDASSYGERFLVMIDGLRTRLPAENVPVVSGELGGFLKDKGDCGHFGIINRQLRELEDRLPAYACVSADGLEDNGDKLHFNTAAQREFGRRYAACYRTLARSGKREIRP